MKRHNLKRKKYNFNIHASIVFQLGETLISDVVQALVELVKNAYDADSTFANISISTDGDSSNIITQFSSTKNYIIIEDDGCGMDLVTIERGWLTISNSLKKEFKKKNLKTKLDRTPLGDKGLGRLGVQRLGHNVEIYTKPDGVDEEHYVAFSWDDFLGKEVLSNVPVVVKTIKPPTRKKGTKIIITNLKDVGSWRGDDAVTKLQSDLSQMISPYKEVQNFLVNVELDGKRLELAEITQQVRETSRVRYKLKFDGDCFSIEGRAKIDLLKPELPDEKLEFKKLVEADNGKNFFSYLTTQKRSKGFSFVKAKEPGWFLSFSYKKLISDFDKMTFVQNKIANPGPFHGEIDGFSLGRDVSTQQDIFNKASQYRNYIKDLSGIRVYRDGFGIRVDRDWLKLGQQWTSAGSYYGLKPENTIGYIALSASDNASLEETTDREGFSITPYYLNFYRMLQEFVAFAGDVQEVVRRNWVSYKKEMSYTTAGLPETTTPKKISERISNHTNKANTYRTKLVDLGKTLDRVTEKTRTSLIASENLFTLDSPAMIQLKSANDLLCDNLHHAKQVIEEIKSYLNEITEIKNLGEILHFEVEALKEQIAQFYEQISLGLTAEALSHEIHNIADHLAERAKSIINHTRANAIKDPKLSGFLEHVQTSISGLRKQLAHFAPSLKYVREKKETINVGEFILDICDFHKGRLKNKKILVTSETDSSNFYININKGKLVQVIDNLILNSEYWVQESIRKKEIHSGKIVFSIKKPYITIFDNGKGVHELYEDSLFEPFVSGKEKPKGRGLGLFIVKQLLDAEACDIFLSPARNEFGRRFKFELDLAGVIDDCN